MDESLFDLRRLAVYLNRSYAHILRMLRQRRLPPPDCHVGRSPMWKRQTIAALVDSGKI